MPLYHVCTQCRAYPCALHVCEGSVSPMPRNSEDTEFASLWEYILCLPASLYTHLWMCAHLCIRVLTVWSPDQQILLAAVVWGRQG